MQMRRLEDRLGKAIFQRQGRASRLTDDGEKLLGYARRMVRLNYETVAAFDDEELSGAVTLGTPGDYAARFLPEVLARFARSNPLVEVTVRCESSPELTDLARAGDVDLAIVTLCGDTGPVEIIRREPLYWVGSESHAAETEAVVPLALDKPPCMWRAAALEALASIGRNYRISLHQRQSGGAFGHGTERAGAERFCRIGAPARHAHPHRGGRFSQAADVRYRSGPVMEHQILADRRRVGRAHRFRAAQFVGLRRLGLEPFRPTLRRFCFSIGEAIRRRSDRRAMPPHRSRSVRPILVGRPPIGNPKGRAILRQLPRQVPRPYPDTLIEP